MSISESSVRAAVGRAIGHIEALLVTDLSEVTDEDGSYPGFLRGLASARKHDLAIVRRELADYLPEPQPCGCGNPAVGKDETGAPICAGCRALVVAAYTALQSIPTQPTRSDR